MTDQADISGKLPGPASEPSDSGKAAPVRPNGGDGADRGKHHRYGWTMICAKMPLAAGNDGLFPERFKRVSKNGVPAFGVIASTVLASAAMIINYLGSNGATVFTTLVLMTGITAAAIPCAFSALAQMKWRQIDHQTLQTPRKVTTGVAAT